MGRISRERKMRKDCMSINYFLLIAHFYTVMYWLWVLPPLRSRRLRRGFVFLAWIALICGMNQSMY
jgi:hypothetical protein